MARINSTNWDERRHPAWLGQPITPRDLLPGGARLDASSFFDDEVELTADGPAAEGDTSITVTAAPDDIPFDAVLKHSDGQYVRLRKRVEEGDTEIEVEALGFAIADTETLTFQGRRQVVIPAGTLVGRTYAERTAGDPFGPYDAAGPDDELFMLAFDVVVEKGDTEADATLLKPGEFVIKVNRLPTWDDMSAAEQDAVRDNWITTVGYEDA